MTDRCFPRRSQSIWCFGGDPNLLRLIGGLGFDW